MSAGFDGIAVALLGQSHPFGIVLSAFFISFIQRGGYFMQLLGIKVEIIDVIIASIIYTSAMAMLVKDTVMKWLNVGGKKK
jgi:simple sugar transport system permease protein